MEKALRATLPSGEFQNVSPARSRGMKAVRGKGNRTTEQRLRFAMVRAAIAGWVLHPKRVPGSPDFLFPAAKLVVFVDGCFWHGCEKCGHLPKSNSAYWSEKVRRNRERDARTTATLRGLGFAVVRLWEHELRQDLRACVTTVRDRLTSA